MSTALKIMTLDDVSSAIEGLRRSGAKIVMANGVFDLLHVGHVRYLEAARRLGDVLVVALNSDRSTRADKGPTRPIVPESERAELIAALACVDFVLIFDEPDVRAVLSRLRPEIPPDDIGMDRGQSPHSGLEGDLEDVVEGALPHLDHQPAAELGVDQAIADLIVRPRAHELLRCQGRE